MRRRFTWILLLPFAHALAQTEQPIPPQQVVISGAQTDVEAGQDFVAGKIIIGSKRIAASGLQNTGELLAREPAVTVGKDGRIGLLGLPGYTQILVDGLPYQGDPMALDLIHVGSIEIIKTSTAATGPFGIAGTINIVRRMAMRKVSSELRTAASSREGRVGGEAAWSSSGLVSGSPLSYLLSVSARQTRRPARSDYIQTSGNPPLLELEGARSDDHETRSLMVTSELSWKLSPTHTLVFSPDVASMTSTSDTREARSWRDGNRLAAAQDHESFMRTASLPLRWNWNIDTDSSLAMNLRLSRSTIEPSTMVRENWLDIGMRQRQQRSEQKARNDFLTLEYKTQAGKSHAVTAGARLARNSNDAVYDDRIDGLPDTSLSVLGTGTASLTNSARLYLQDEWRIDRVWALNLGTSVERQRYRLVEGPATNRSAFTMWSPSAHVSHRIGGNRKRQLRMSLARSYQAPFMDQLLLRPTINTFAPCLAGQLCGANGIDNADTSGNPFLQPERALGLNLSYAHGFGRDSEVQLEFYARDIGNKIGTEVMLLDVPWASAPRYVAREVNLGQARVRGLSLEARLAGKDIAAGLASLELSGSIGLADSELSDLPGPDNKLAEQSPWNAKLSASYALKAVPVKLGVDASYLPQDWARYSVNQRVFESRKRTLNLHASWNISKRSTLRFQVDNLLPQDPTRIDEYLAGSGMVRRVANASSHALFLIRFNTQL